MQVIDDSGDCNDAESGQEQLAEYFHTECHPIVFSEIDIAPVSDPDAFVEIHVCLYGNLDKLVDDQYQKDDYQGKSALSQ